MTTVEIDAIEKIFFIEISLVLKILILDSELIG